ncbi:MAG: BON domain-containing protein [Myxococcales bacterium]|nr:BON domain-containing protein [Myxococcales bacterium]MCB9669920.1 BON domain-containing protein [Alphaproteobacteria bacterium]MCB9693206.1 BON domain-containing protein [Alphaproteobacteria bacterium]
MAPHAEAAVRFDSASRQAHSDQPIPIGGVPRALREAAELSGLDPLPQLYNESLRYATEGHLRLARERLQMLLCMAPDDGEARLLLAKVYVAGQRWQDALAALDEAEACGSRVPVDLREMVELQLQATHAGDDEERASLLARERGEIKALRAEARRLRSENAALAASLFQQEKEVRKWAWATAGVSTLTILFILTSLVMGRSSSVPTVTVETAPVAAAAPAAARGQGTAEAPRTPAATAQEIAAGAADDASLAARAAGALASSDDLEGTHLEVIMNGGRASLVGQVQSARQRAEAERTVAGLPGIAEVSTDRVEILARTRGTVHTVGRGETLSHIAMRYYGTVTLANRIAKANPGSKTLHIGDELKIPAVD